MPVEPITLVAFTVTVLPAVLSVGPDTLIIIRYTMSSGRRTGFSTIKSHHNVGGLPEKMNLELVEPLRELFKDKVRTSGRQFGLPEEFVGRHPCPEAGTGHTRSWRDFTGEVGDPPEGRHDLS